MSSMCMRPFLQLCLEESLVPPLAMWLAVDDTGESCRVRVQRMAGVADCDRGICRLLTGTTACAFIRLDDVSAVTTAAAETLDE